MLCGIMGTKRSTVARPLSAAVPATCAGVGALRPPGYWQRDHHLAGEDEHAEGMQIGRERHAFCLRKCGTVLVYLISDVRRRGNSIMGGSGGVFGS